MKAPVTEDIDDVGSLRRVVTFEMAPEEGQGCGQWGRTAASEGVGWVGLALGGSCYT